MAKHTKEHIIELDTEDTNSPPLSGESKMDTHLNSCLSISEVLSEMEPITEHYDSQTNDTFPSNVKSWEKGKEHSKLSGIVVGLLQEINDRHQPLVDFPGNPEPNPLLARTTIVIKKSNIQQEALLMFERGDPRKPIIMGLLPPADNYPNESLTDKETEEKQPTLVELDGESLIFTAKNEIVLKCGKSSITLTKAGKILIRGAYLLCRSSGVNRVKGGSVQIN